MKRPRRQRSDGSSADRSHGRAHDPHEASRRPASGSDWTSGTGTTHALFLRGREAEDAGDVRGALALFAEAAATLDLERSPAEVATLARHVATCYALIGDGQSAWKMHLLTARFFHRLEVKVDFGASLAEAGAILVQSKPPEPEAVLAEVTHASLLGGVADVVAHAVDVLLVDEALPSVGEAAEVHRQLTGLMVLATCAAADHPLGTGAVAIYNRIVIPFGERHSIGPETPMGDARTIFITFMGLSRLWAAIADQERPDRAGVPPTEDEVEALSSHVALAFQGASRPSMSSWLGSYLRDRRGADWATDAYLLASGGGR